MPNKLIRLTESDLHRIIKESVNNILNEVLDEPTEHDDAYRLAGAAKGATETLGGKIKGMFNPKWKERKQRQYDLFANRGEELRDKLTLKNKGNKYYDQEEEIGLDNDSRRMGYNNPKATMRRFYGKK